MSFIFKFPPISSDADIIGFKFGLLFLSTGVGTVTIYILESKISLSFELSLDFLNLINHS